MIVSDAGQARVFIINILVGMLCVVLFDFFGALVKRYGKSPLIINLMDIGLYITVFCLVLFAGVKFNFGALRYYQIIGIGLGCIIHKCLFSKVEKKLFEKLLVIFEKGIKLVKKLISVPLIFILRIVFTPVVFVENKLMNMSSKCKKKLAKANKKRKKTKKNIKKRMKML